MEHIPDHQRAVQELVRVLKPGNTLVVSVPRYWPERICWALSDDYANSNQGHIRIYKYDELLSLLERFGLSQLAVHNVPRQKSIIEVYKTGIGTCRTDQAFQPPEGGMQAVGVMH